MVEDGMNDAQTLTQADIGISIDSGTDVALSSGHIIFLKSDPSNFVRFENRPIFYEKNKTELIYVICL
jgi:P-type Cu2+ transporter